MKNACKYTFSPFVIACRITGGTKLKVVQWLLNRGLQDRQCLIQRSPLTIDGLRFSADVAAADLGY